MATQSAPEQGLPSPETVMQHSIFQQAQAAAAAQTNAASPMMRHEVLLQNTDLTIPDAAEDDMPPPAYGDVQGEIRNEKDGLGTSVHVADDGRVNIRINQLNRRLSQIFTPALRQQVQGAQDSSQPTSPFIPHVLGGEVGVSPPPRLTIVIQVVGSRGDVQPFIALGKVLKENYGHRVRLATHPNFKNFVEENGLEFFSIGGDPSRLMAFMVKNPGLMPRFRSLVSGDVGQRRRDVSEYIQGCWRSCYEAGGGMDPHATDDDLSEISGNDSGPESSARPFVADCIIANPPSFAHIHCAEKLGIPLHIMFTMPYSPTQAFPHPLANIQSSNADPQLTNSISYAIIELLTWQGLGDIINRFRKKCLGLDSVSTLWAPGMLQRLRIPHTYCWSPALIPKPRDWGSHISISGFFLLKSPNYIPPSDLQAFLDAGPIPIYIGFGSIVLDDPNAMTELIFKAVRKTGQRIILSKGWGGICVENVPDDVFMVGNVPHDWLFKQVSCVVHHGGAGTTAAGITAGRPTLVVPFFGDQPFWGAMVARAGAGPDPIPIKQLTADNLADAINFCLKPESMDCAKELASKIAAERGNDMGAQSFHQHLEVDRLRCMLAPSRPATWRIRRTQIRLSAFAACTLANANLLDFHDLKLFRPQEHCTDEGPWDPISGGFTIACRAFSDMTMGLAELPSETYKAFQIPSGSSRQKSQASIPTIPSKNETSRMGEETTPPTLPEQSQTSLNVHDSLDLVQSPSKLSRLSSYTSKTRSSSMSGILEGQSSHDASRNRVRSRVEYGPGQDHDMMRQIGVHTNKGAGRFVKALVQSPMEISLGLTKGLHNVPKLWGDGTVRPQERVSDFKSGMRAVGREFAFGWYDGVTGLFTQPWNGAQKEGANGVFKGLGKGFGGFIAKPSAAMLGILGHSMKGVHKEVQKLFGSNVQSYIIASRAAQGYEEWLQSSDEETQDVIVRWKLIQKYLKKKHNPDEMMRDVLDAQQKTNMEKRQTHQDRRHAASPTQSVNSADTSIYGGSRLSLANTSSGESLEAAEMNKTIQTPAKGTSRGDAEENVNVSRANQESASHLHRQQQETADDQAAEEDMRQAMAASEALSQRHVSEALEHERQLKRVMAQSLMEQRRKSSDSEWELGISSDAEEDEESEQAREHPKGMAENVGGSTWAQQPPSYDPGHLAGTTQSEFEAQEQRQQGEKTTQEKTEEEIVMEYIKKQSLLEVHHGQKGKGRATVTDAEDYEDLQKALKLSMQGHGVLYGEASAV